MLRALWLAILMFATAIAHAEPVADFAGSWRDAGAPVCRATESALVLALRPSELLAEFDAPLRSLNTALALREAAPGQSPPGPNACARAEEVLTAPNPSAGALSAALPDKLILVLISPGRAETIRVLGHVPGLTGWAAEPMIQTHVLDAESLSGVDRADLLSRALRVAADASVSLRYFLDGHRTAAVASRPPPASLDPLPRAWLSGIPLREESAKDWVASLDREPQFDSFVRPVGDSVLQTLLDKLVPARTAAPSAPARRMACIGADGDTRWAGFVAGYWRAAADPRGFSGYGDLVPAGPLAPSPQSPFEAGASCLDATLYPLLAKDAAEGLPAQVALDRLDAAVWAEFGGATGATIAARQRLAREILAAQLGAARLDWLAANRGKRFYPYFPTGGCTGPRTWDVQAVQDLVAAVDPIEASVVALPIRLAQGLPFGRSATTMAADLAAAHELDWISSAPDLQEALALEALRLWPEAGGVISARFTVPEERLSSLEAVRLLTQTGTIFAENADRIRDDFDTFGRQAELAHALVSWGWWTNMPFLAAGQLNAAALYRQFAALLAPHGVSNRLIYARFIRLFPELKSDAFRERLFESSDANALRIAAVDLLQSLSDLEEGRADLVAEDRDIWGRFASSSGLPERPIPQVLSGEDHAASIAALHRLTLVIADWQRADAGDSAAERARVHLEAASGPLAVQIDLMRPGLDDEAPEAAYRPGAEARTLYDFLRTQIREETFAALLDEPADEGPEDFADAWAHLEPIWLAARPWLSLWLRSDEDPFETEAELIDAEIATRLLLSFIHTDRERRWTAAERLRKRLVEDRGWPPALRRLAARFALLSLDDTTQVARDAHREAIF